MEIFVVFSMVVGSVAALVAIANGLWELEHHFTLLQRKRKQKKPSSR